MMAEDPRCAGATDDQLPLLTRYAAVFSASADAVLISDRHGRIVDANPTAEQMFGHRRAELLGRNPVEVVQPADGPLRLGNVLDLVRQGRRWTGDITYTRSDGSTGICESTVSGIWSDDGGFIGAVGLNRDVTVARQTATELARAEQRWRLTLDHAPIGIALVGLDGRWLRVNEALCAIVGHRESGLLGRSFLDITHPDDVENDRSLVERLVSGTLSHYRMEKRFVHARGHPVPVSISVALVRDETDTPLHLVCQIEDITDRRTATEQLAAQARQDPLTGLANRTALLDELATIAAAPPRVEPFAVAFADLDGFKPVNDRYGHAAGDQLLRIAAQRITATLRPGDIAARLGGDEFVLLLLALPEPADLHPIAERLLAAFNAPFHLDAATLTISASLGIVTGGVAGDDPAALLSRADAAMYRAKTAGKNTYHVD